MTNSYRTPYDDKPYQAGGSGKRYATAAVLITGALIGGSAVGPYVNRTLLNRGTAFNHNGQQYYVPGDSKRARYPSKEACMRDVPPARQSECEPIASYRGSSHGGWYGPVFNQRDSYQPSSQYPTETAGKSNMGQRLPSGANTDGFGSNGKAFTGSKGG